MNIVVFSRNAALYSTQSIVNAAKIRNHYVRVIDHQMCDIVINDKGTELFYNNAPIKHVDAIIPRIGTTATYFGASVIRHYQHKNIFTSLTSNALLSARDKLSCLQILSLHGIQVPHTVYCNNLWSLPHMLTMINTYPLVIKLVSGTHGVGVILAENASSAESIFETLINLKEKVLLQEFIKEAQGTDIRAFVVNGKVVAAMKRHAKEGDFRSNLHRGGWAQAYNLTHDEEQVAIKSAECLGLQIAGVDMLISKKGPLVLEVNASPGLEGIENATGEHVGMHIIKYVEKAYMSHV